MLPEKPEQITAKISVYQYCYKRLLCLVKKPLELEIIVSRRKTMFESFEFLGQILPFAGN